MTKNSENSYNTATNIFEHFVAQNIMLSVNDWQQLNSSFINALKVERNVMFLILSLIIIVAAFNIISSLIMLVNDKLKHIALLRTMGLSTGAVTRIFFINGALIGLIGTLIGSVLGTLFSYNIDNIKKSLESLTGATLFDPLIYFLTDLPAEINPLTILLVILISLLICFLAAIYPARKAAKLQPVEILRYE
jgi:lipoprotein-releasing system permease protein